MGLSIELVTMDIIRLLLDHGADVNATDESGATMLEKSFNSSEEAVRLLISRGAAVPKSFVRSTKVIAQLLDAGAAIDAVDKSGRTPLRVAAGYEHPDSTRVLLSYGANLNARDDSGWTPLHYAKSAPHSFTVFIVLSSSSSESDKNGKTGIKHTPVLDSSCLLP